MELGPRSLRRYLSGRLRLPSEDRGRQHVSGPRSPHRGTLRPRPVAWLVHGGWSLGPPLDRSVGPGCVHRQAVFVILVSPWPNSLRRNMLTATHLTRRFGDRLALDDVSFS